MWYKGEIAARALVDDEDFGKVSEQVWYLRTDGRHRKVYYAQANVKAADGKWRTERLHRVILGLTERAMQADHIDGNGLNNRWSNLRPATRSQNAQNLQKQMACKGRPTSSQYRGVNWDKVNQRWLARVMVNRKTAFCRSFNTEEEAAKAVAAARAKLHPFSQEAMELQRSA